MDGLGRPGYSLVGRVAAIFQQLAFGHWSSRSFVWSILRAGVSSTVGGHVTGDIWT